MFFFFLLTLATVVTEQSYYKLCECIYMYVYNCCFSIQKLPACFAKGRTSTERNPVPASKRSMFKKSQLSKCKRGNISARGKQQRVNYMPECPGLQNVCHLLFRVKAFTWPWEAGLWEREPWAGLWCLLTGHQWKQAGTPGSVRIVQRITLILKQVGTKVGMADGAGSSRSRASLAAIPSIAVLTPELWLAFSSIAVLVSSCLFL